MKRKLKKKCQMKHAKVRFRERFGLELNNELHDKFVRSIQLGFPYAEFLKKQTNRITIWKILYNGNYIVLVYDKNRKQIVTAIPDNEQIKEQ